MENKPQAIEDFEGLCFKCLCKKNDIKTFSLYRSEYGSSFDNYYTYLQICSDCKPKDLEKWFDEEPEINDYWAKYEYEENIIDFVNTLPLEGQELFWNRCADGSCAHTMESQDWIDMKLGKLSDEKYEEYCMYSPRQIKAYQIRFSTCEHPVNATFNDGSQGCYCPFGASGEYNQMPDKWNISKECFDCSKYKPRETQIKEMDYDTYKKYKVYIQGKEFSHLFE